jgi:hypothetical protein
MASRPTWQFNAIVALPALALILLVLSAFFPLPAKRRLRTLGSVMTVAGAVVAALVW